MTGPATSVDLDRLLKLRLVVARFGEMDIAKWWNTQGLLGPRGAAVIRRGLPRTHYFAQARVVFAVARARCSELFSPPGCVTLWELPAELEDQFEERWQQWLDDTETWTPVFERLALVDHADLVMAMEQFGLLSPVSRDLIAKLRRSAEGRAVQVPALGDVTDDLLVLLAGGFSRGEVAMPSIPYAKVGGVGQ